MITSSDYEADKLLADAGFIGKEQGIYTEVQLSQQRRQRGEVSLDEQQARKYATTALDGITMSSLKHSLRGKCSVRAIECFECWAIGYTPREISEKKYMNISETTVRSDIRHTLLILRKDPTLGIVEVLVETFCMPRGAIIDIICSD